jgi:carboxylesterase type B
MGQSSGGTSVLAHLAAPDSRGLFHGGISLSGSPNITMGLPQAEAQNAPIVGALGCAKG